MAILNEHKIHQRGWWPFKIHKKVQSSMIWIADYWPKPICQTTV
jgi:hypothetical protein